MRKSMIASYLDGLEMLEGESRRESFQLSSDLLDQIHCQWMKGAPDNRAIVMHRRADPDEAVARIVAVKSEAGQSVLLGISMQTPILFTDTPKDFSDRPEGKMFLGVGDVGFNEHNLPSSVQGTICCADMTAKYLEEDQNPTLMPLIEAARLDDLYAKSAPDSLAQMMKRAYRLGESTESVVNWATERYDEWRRSLSLDLTDPEMFSVGGYHYLVANEHFPAIVNDEVLGPLVKKQREKRNGEPDSLMQVLFRSYALGNPLNEVREWGEERVQQWKKDLHNSHCETLWPELLACGEIKELKIGSSIIKIALIRTEKLSSSKYTEYMAKFARWRKGWDAAVVIQVNENGNVQIFPNQRYGIRLDSVISFLINHEGNIWHGQFNTALNGSLKHDQPPTKFTPEQLVEIVRQHAWIEH